VQFLAQLPLRPAPRQPGSPDHFAELFVHVRTAEALKACRRFAALRPDVARLLPALPWREVPAFMAGAAVTAISSLEPETFCFVAAEALSVGTPLVTFDLGYVPTLAGDAGRVVPLEAGFDGMWAAITDLLTDPAAYHAASAAAAGRVFAHTPLKVADAFLAAVA
jgi:glycosyltransferase involved in cell wall biosynthesis